MPRHSRILTLTARAAPLAASWYYWSGRNRAQPYAYFADRDSLPVQGAHAPNANQVDQLTRGDSAIYISTGYPALGAYTYTIRAPGGVAATGRFVLTDQTLTAGGLFGSPVEYRLITGFTLMLTDELRGDDTMDELGVDVQTDPLPALASFETWAEVRGIDAGAGLSIVGVDSGEARTATVRVPWRADIDPGMSATLDGDSYTVQTVTTIIPYHTLELGLVG